MVKNFNHDSSSNDPFQGINLGDKAKDTVTGFKGYVMARSEYITGCHKVLIKPKTRRSDESQNGYWIDIERVEKIIDDAIQGSDIPNHEMGAIK